jgi:hypothetical protein
VTRKNKFTHGFQIIGLLLLLMLLGTLQVRASFWELSGNVVTHDQNGSNWVIARHAYDATDNGTPKLLISDLNWRNNWPIY